MSSTLILLALLGQVQKVEPKVDAPPPLPLQASIAAFQDARKYAVLRPGRIKGVRYLFVHRSDLRHLGASVAVFNMVVPDVAYPVYPHVIPLPCGYVLRFDFFDAFHDAKRLENALNTWEFFAEFEPYFHNLSSFVPQRLAWKLEKCDPYKIGGVEHKFRWVNLVIQADEKVKAKSAALAIHAGGKGPLKDLSEIVGSQVPIVRYDWFFIVGLSAIDLGHGQGQYYRFRGTLNQTLDQFLKALGVKEGAKYADGKFASASLILNSQVTGHFRRAVFLRTNTTRLGNTSGLITITEDASDEQVADANDPFRNLVQFKFAASEVLYELPSGLIASNLFDAAGNQQASAPDNVVHDHKATLPGRRYGTRRLDGGIISCGRCHVAESDSIYQKIPNDLEKLLFGANIKVFDDVTVKGDSGIIVKKRADVIKDLKGLYGFQPEVRLLPTAREYYHDAVEKVCGKYFQDSKNVTVDVWGVIATVFNEYAYGLVSAEAALLELGIPVKGGKVGALNAEVFLHQQFLLKSKRVDPVVGLLISGFKIHRYQYERLYTEMADCLFLKANAGGAGGAVPGAGY